ncbi:MHS family MFS transporter [Mycolicibacterium boenickei]|nr:MHS family MFS transporter [Mycolicibacterium boenickei]
MNPSVPAADTDAAAAKSRRRRTIVASMVGTTIEWYDFNIYGAVAALAFGKIFFPDVDPAAGTLLALATFGVGFAARPIGGIIFGHIGDRVGRKAALIATIMMMGVATVAIGLLPTYDSIGIWAPVLLVLCRLIQGIGLGGEWGGAVLMVVEQDESEDSRGRAGSWMQSASPMGFLLATATLAAVSAFMTEGQFMSWGWRIPFLLSAPLVLVGLLIRVKIIESTVFIRNQQQLKEKEVKAPILQVLRHAPKMILLVVLLGLGQQVAYFVINVFSLSYVTQHTDISKATVLNAVAVGAVVQLLSILYFGRLSDRVGRRIPFFIGAIGMAVWAFAVYPLMGTGNFALMVLSVSVAMVFQGAMYGVLAAFIAELFDTSYRYTGVSLGYMLIGVVGGGFAPLIASSLLDMTGSVTSVAVYISASSVLTLIAAYFAPETSKRNLDNLLDDGATTDPAPQRGQSVAHTG